MPMIDVYAAEGTFKDRKALAVKLAAAVMRWEGVPEIALFKENTAAFIHVLAPDALSNVSGDSNYVRVQILTPGGAPAGAGWQDNVSNGTELLWNSMVTAACARNCSHAAWSANWARRASKRIHSPVDACHDVVAGNRNRTKQMCAKAPSFARVPGAGGVPTSGALTRHGRNASC